MKFLQRKALLGALAAVSLTATLVPATAALGRILVSNNYRQPIEVEAMNRGNDAVGLTSKPGNPKHIVSVNADVYAQECEYGVSFDGGRTWTGGELQAPANFSGRPCSTVGHGWSAMDQSVDFGRRNNVFTTFASVAEGSGTQSVLVARSRDGGRTFDTARVALPGGPDIQTGPEYRFPKLVARGRTIYLVAWHQVRPPGQPPIDTVRVAVSHDSGQTWSDPVQVSAEGVRAIEPTQPVIGPDGSVYVGYRVSGFEGSLVVAKSEDGGQTWSRTTAAPVRGFDTGTTQFSASSFPRLAADLSDGPNRGNLYMVYNQVPVDGSYPGMPAAADHFIGPDADVLFVKSQDGNNSWSTPQLINETDSPDLTQNRHPNVSVADNGRIDVVWHDRRHSYKQQTCPNTHSPPAGTAPCEEARFGDTYYTSSSDGGETWKPNRRITDRSINNDVGSDYRFGIYWDFGPVSLPLGNEKVLFAWMDSRRGNFHNDNVDIFFAKVNLASTKAPRTTRISRPNVVKLSAALSKVAYEGGLEAVLASTFASRGRGVPVIVNKNDVGLALAGGVLSRSQLGPVLLSGPNGLSRAVKAELRRLTPTGAYLLGGEVALGSGVLSDVQAILDDTADANIERLTGTQAKIAAAAAAEMDRRTDEQKTAGTPAFDAAVIVNPNRKDAAAAAGLASHRRLPVLFVTRNAVPQATTNALASLDIDRTLVIGGTRSISNTVAAGLPQAERVGNNKLYETSRDVVSESRQRLVPFNIVYVADGRSPMQGALLGHVAGRAGGVVLLSPDASVRAARANLGRLVRHIDRLVVAFTS